MKPFGDISNFEDKFNKKAYTVSPIFIWLNDAIKSVVIVVFLVRPEPFDPF